jgi:hypothetical protein
MLVIQQNGKEQLTPLMSAFPPPSRPPYINSAKCDVLICVQNQTLCFSFPFASSGKACLKYELKTPVVHSHIVFHQKKQKKKKHQTKTKQTQTQTQTTKKIKKITVLYNYYVS